MSDAHTMPESPFFTRDQAASYLGVSTRQLDGWIRGGKIKVVKLGRLVRVHRTECERIEREGI